MKRLSVALLLLCSLTFLGNVVVFADDLADVQKVIKEKKLKWVAERLPDPEKHGLGLLKDGFMGALAPESGESQVLTAVAPASLDWRSIGSDNLFGVAPGNYVSPIKDQGACGSCWAFATTATAESSLQIAYNNPIVPGTPYNLSEQVTLDCSGGGSCNGGYITTASSYIASTGLLSETPAGCYAYNPGSTTCPNPSLYPSCDQARYRIDSWKGISATVDAMKNALNSYGPLVTTFAVRNDFYRYYRSGVYEASACDATNPLVGYHAVSLVGYQDADATHPVGYFIVKNSWGAGWGESGYFRVGYSQVGNCVGFGASTLAYSKTVCAGDIAVTSPVTSDVLQAGTTHPITWTATGNVGQYVKIDLFQNGVFNRTIQTSAPEADGSYQWLVNSDLGGAEYSVVVTSTACSSASGAGGSFTILPAETFAASGSVIGTAASGVAITFSRVTGTGTVPVAALTDSNGIWSQSGFQTGTVYRATPSKPSCSFSPAYRDFSGAVSALDFTVTQSVVSAVTNPAAGVSWKAGGAYLITWTYTGNPGAVAKIELLNGSGAKLISSKAGMGSGGNGAYSWKINKQQAVGSYRIRVTSTTNGSSATSGTFNIIK